MLYNKTFRLAYVLPALHLGACITSYVGLIFPRLQYFGVIFTFVLMADLPVSLVTYFTAWRYGAFAVFWTVVVGTCWWYALGRAAEGVIRRISDSRRNQPDSFFSHKPP